VTDPIPQCCKAVAWRVAGAEQEVRRLASLLARNDTPRGRMQLAIAKDTLTDNKRWADEHHATHAGDTP
jgi:hypothetical protein